MFLHGPRNLDAKDYRTKVATDDRMVRSSLLKRNKMIAAKKVPYGTNFGAFYPSRSIGR